MTKQQQRQIDLAKKHAAVGNKSSAARIISHLIRSHVSPISARASWMQTAIELGVHSHPDFKL
jgi:hypothetical protein